MSNTITQAPFALVALMLGCGALEKNLVLSTSNVATLELHTAIEGLPSECTSVSMFTVEMPPVGSEGLAARAFAQLVIPNSRPMEQWEKQHADEFFWSQFS